MSSSTYTSSAPSFKSSFSEIIIKRSLSAEAKTNFEKEEFESLIEKLDLFSNNLKSNKNLTNKNSTFFSSLTKAINSRLYKLQSDSFDKIAFKLYNKLTDVSKEFLNQLKINSGENSKNEVFRFNLINLNLCLANFFKFFQKQFQNYNEVHKNIIKNTPNFLKIFFKLFEENLETILSQINSSYEKTDLIKSFLGFIATMMHTQPNMLRPFEAKLENMINKVLIYIINCGQIDLVDKSFIELTTSLYCYSVYLSNDINKKFPSILDKCIASLKYYLKLIEPVGIKNKKNVNMGNAKNSNKLNEIINEENHNKNNTINNKNSGNNKETNFEFFFDEISESIARDSVKVRNCFYLIFKLIKNLFKIITPNQILDLNLKRLISFSVKNLFADFSNTLMSEYIISGLPAAEYKLIISYLRFLSLKLLMKIISIFTPYLNYFIALFKDIAKKLTIYKVESNKKNNFDNFLEMKTQILKFTQILIEKFDLKVNSFTKEYVKKMAISEFCDVLICFLEKNDKTIVKIDKSYFKLGATANANTKAKNSGANKGKATISLLDIAKQETYNSKLDIYDNAELEELIICYLNIFEAYAKSETFIYSTDEEKSCIKSVIDLVCFPAYAKFLFSLSPNLKNKFVSLINVYICSMINSKKNSNDEVNLDERILFFLKNIYNNESSNSDLISTFSLIHNEKNLKIITTPEKTINLSESFLDLNKKIKERFSEILSERELNFTQNLNKSNSLLPVSERNVLDIPSESSKTTKVFEAHNINDPALLGKKTIRNSPLNIINEQVEDLLFDKFAIIHNNDKDMKNRKLENAGINEYKSKTSANFYLYLNKNNSASTYLNFKNKKDDEKIQNELNVANKETEFHGEKENKHFSLRFRDNNNVEANEENLDLNELDENRRNEYKTANTENNLDDEDDEISIPDII